jgi:hypothetical protein
LAAICMLSACVFSEKDSLKKERIEQHCERSFSGTC